MDIDRNRTQGQFPQRQPLTCWRCKQSGHIARDCRLPINFLEMDYEQIRAMILGNEKQKQEKEATEKKEEVKVVEDKKEGF